MNPARRLYYTDSHLTDFDAVVTETIDVGGREAVVLDQSAFYPTSGGQPFDTGTLDEVSVVDVVDLEDGRVAHVVASRIEPGRSVHGRIDWSRRFDHMQQHTGQHVLSAAFDRLHDARTESFHLGSDASTIDFARAVSPEMVAAAEAEANRIVWEDRPVLVRFVSAEEAAALPLRKEPAKTGMLRLVEVQEFDLSACGGTHVARTGAVGLVAITGQERFKGGTRVEFVCGRRALARFHELRAAVAGAVRHLSVTVPELPQALERLQSDLKEHRQRLTAARERLAEHDARALAGRGERVGELMVVCEALEGADVQSLKTMAQALGSQPGQVAILLGADSPHLAVVSRGPGAAVDAAAVLKGLTTRFGGKGGGRPELAQGGGLVGETAEILAAARASIEAART